MGITYISIVIGSAYPTKVFIDTGKFNSLTGVLIPGVDEGSSLEMWLNICYLSVSTLIARISLLCIQIIIGLFADTVTAEITILEMQELSEHLEQNTLSSREVQLRVKRFMVQILKEDR